MYVLCTHSTKFVDDRWMQCNGYMEPPSKPSWWDLPVTSLGGSPPVTLSPSVTCSEAVVIMKRDHVSQLPIVSDTEGCVLEAYI